MKHYLGKTNELQDALSREPYDISIQDDDVYERVVSPDGICAIDDVAIPLLVKIAQLVDATARRVICRLTDPVCVIPPVSIDFNDQRPRISK